MKRELMTLLLTACLAMLGGCATNPVSGGSDFVLMSEDQEISLGRRYNAEIIKQMPKYDDPALQQLVEKVGARLAAHSHRTDLIYRFTVLDSQTVNAFALPGGYIYITRGMLAYLNSEAELAAVLGHEIGHVTARHSVRQHSTSTVAGILGAVVAASTGIQGADTLTDLVGTAVVRGYGREHELEADRLGAEYLARSGYDPDAMLEVVGVLKNQEVFETAIAKKEDRDANVYHGLFSTHPDNDARFKAVVAAARHLRSNGKPRVERESFLDTIDGLVFGDSPRDGITRGNRFYHSDMDIALTFPEGWRIENHPKKLLATPRSNDGVVQVTIAERNKRISPERFMKDRLDLGDLSGGKTFNANGLTGYTAIATAGTPWGKRPVRFVVLYQGDDAWIFAGAAKNTASKRKYDSAVLDTARSLKPLTENQKKLAEGKRIRVITAGKGTTYAGLAKNSPLSNYPEEQLRLINDQYPDGEPRARQLLKVIR